MHWHPITTLSAVCIVLCATSAAGEKSKKSKQRFLWGVKPCQSPEALRKSFSPTQGSGAWNEKQEGTAFVLQWQGDEDQAVPRRMNAAFVEGVLVEIEVFLVDETVINRDTLTKIARKLKMVPSSGNAGWVVWKHPTPVPSRWRLMEWQVRGQGLKMQLKSQCIPHTH